MNNNTLKIILILLIATIVFGYILFRFYPLISGPHITLIDTSEEIVTQDKTIILDIETERVVALTVQGLGIDIDESGVTQYRYNLSDGPNTISITGCDQYESCKTISVFVYKRSG